MHRTKPPGGGHSAARCLQEFSFDVVASIFVDLYSALNVRIFPSAIFSRGCVEACKKTQLRREPFTNQHGLRDFEQDFS